MQRLNRDMLSRYDIPLCAPEAVGAVQFGAGRRLLGAVDPLLAAACPSLGLACLLPERPWTGPGEAPAKLLGEQEGLYTLLVRGYAGETPVKEERVIQSILSVGGEALLEALAVSPEISLGILDTLETDPEAQLDQAARFLSLRMGAGLGGLALICLGEAADCAEGVKAGILERCPEPAFARWLEGCRFCPAQADSLAFRAPAKEAARQCAEMNYLDGMLHLAEPWARLTIQAPAGALPFAATQAVALVDDLDAALAVKRRAFDAGLFLMAAPGWLMGLDTLSDCMKHERLRAFVGRAYQDEVLPRDPAERGQLAQAVIDAFARFENPLNPSPILPAAAPLTGLFRRSALPLIRARAREDFGPPRGLSFALAATIMLYAGARRGESGRWEVLRGTQVHTLEDDPEALRRFSTLSHDMDPQALAYAVLADRELWGGEDLRDIDGLMERVALDIAALQRMPGWLPGE